MRSAIFLDRDGTLIEDRGDLSSPEHVVFYPNTIKALRLLAPHYVFFIVTNQSGVGKGSIASHAAQRVNDYVRGRLKEAGIEIKDVYTCPHTTEEGCVCKKPKPHFLHKAAKDHCIDLERSFVIGDHPHDVELAENAGATGIYLLTGHGEKHKDELREGRLICSDILSAAKKITSSSL
jgi:histidinol-phosphate phosphatase family protein